MASLCETSDVDVTFTWQRDGNRRYLGDTADARGPPQFLSRHVKIWENGAQIRIGGVRPMEVTVYRGNRMVYQKTIISEKSCMNIHFIRNRYLPSSFTVYIENVNGKTKRQFDVDEDAF